MYILTSLMFFRFRMLGSPQLSIVPCSATEKYPTSERSNASNQQRTSQEPIQVARPATTLIKSLADLGMTSILICTWQERIVLLPCDTSCAMREQVDHRPYRDAATRRSYLKAVWTRLPEHEDLRHGFEEPPTAARVYLHCNRSCI